MPPVSPLLPGITAANPEALPRLIAAGIANRRAATGQVAVGTVRMPLGCVIATLGARARARGAA
jgi:hypothetical protein